MSDSVHILNLSPEASEAFACLSCPGYAVLSKYVHCPSLGFSSSGSQLMISCQPHIPDSKRVAKSSVLGGTMLEGHDSQDSKA